MEIHADVTKTYSDFLGYLEAEGARGTCFEEWTTGVLGDPEVQEWLGTLPEPKRQPNLVFAAARWHGVPAPGPYAGLRDALLGDDGAIRETILSRSTQTNEVGRLATLTPAFAQVAGDEPVALIEVGASAGLCLYPDRWSYAWHTTAGTVRAGEGPTLECRVDGAFPTEITAPAVAWRGGVDLNPGDVDDSDQMAWLTNLVFPEEEDRRERLGTAIGIARTDPPHLVKGDLLDELPRLVDEASEHGRVVVFHSAVIAYLEEADRRRYFDLVSGLVADGRCHWVSNEGKRVLPEVTATGPEIPEERQTFVLGVDGQAVAWTHGHGRTMTWLGPA
ncbi:DUF2332 domain-containing protein [Nocardioides sp. GCM10027113]|uniref:DUF2332 domain-containing protein n=1 Tax=unclassified Nocardioides TaxID=2615069 RepID=UPI0036201404